jgi:hypothetical protein
MVSRWVFMIGGLLYEEAQAMGVEVRRLRQASTRIVKLRATSAMNAASSISPFNQRTDASDHRLRPTMKPFTTGLVALRKLSTSVRHGLIQAQNHGATAMRVTLGNQTCQRRPARSLHGRQLPPLGFDAQVVKPLDGAQHGFVGLAGGGEPLGAMISSSNSLPLARVASHSSSTFCSCSSRRPERIVRVVVHQALHHLLGWPVDEGAADGARAVETQRARAGQLHRPTHPPASPGGAGQCIGTIVATVDQHAGWPCSCGCSRPVRPL